MALVPVPCGDKFWQGFGQYSLQADGVQRMQRMGSANRKYKHLFLMLLEPLGRSANSFLGLVRTLARMPLSAGMSLLEASLTSTGNISLAALAPCLPSVGSNMILLRVMPLQRQAPQKGIFRLAFHPPPSHEAFASLQVPKNSIIAPTAIEH